MTSKQKLSERLKSEIEMIDLHLNLAKMDARDGWAEQEHELSLTFQNINRFFKESLGLEEERVKKQATHISTKAEVMARIMALRKEKEAIENAKIMAEVDQLDAEANKTFSEMSESIDQLLAWKELEGIRTKFKSKFDEKLLLAKKYMVLQDEFFAIKDKQDQMTLDLYIEKLEKERAVLEVKQTEVD